MLKRIFIVLCLSLCIFNFAYATDNSTITKSYSSLWGDIEREELTGERLEEAIENLVTYEYVLQDEASTQTKIWWAGHRADKVIVWFGEGMTAPAFIGVYDLDGNFEFGYRMQFRLGNGFANIDLEGDDLLVLMVSADCIYHFSKDSVKYMFAPPEYVSTQFLNFAGDPMKEEYKALRYTSSEVMLVKHDGSTETVVRLPEGSGGNLSKADVNIVPLTFLGLFVIGLLAIILYDMLHK